MSRKYKFCPECGAALIDKESYGQFRRVCPECDFIQFHDPKVAACAFIRQNGKVLLVKRAVEPEIGKWSLPGGYVDYGESPEDATKRETAEETGLSIEITRLYDVMFFEELNAVIIIFYEARLTGGELRPADDAEAVAWFAVDELPEIAFKSTQIVLQRWQQDIKKPD